MCFYGMDDVIQFTSYKVYTVDFLLPFFLSLASSSVTLPPLPPLPHPPLLLPPPPPPSLPLSPSHTHTQLRRGRITAYSARPRPRQPSLLQHHHQHHQQQLVVVVVVVAVCLAPLLVDLRVTHMISSPPLPSPHTPHTHLHPLLLTHHHRYVCTMYLYTYNYYT